MSRFDRLRRSKRPEAPSPSEPSGEVDESGEGFDRVFVYVYLTPSLSDELAAAAAKQIEELAGTQFLATDTFPQIMDLAEKRKCRFIRGHGSGSSPDDSVPTLGRWLATHGTSVRQSKKVLGKSIVTTSGEGTNPTNGKQFKWDVYWCFG